MLKGESFQPCALKIGPSKNGRQAISMPAARATVSARETAGYEYVLASSNHTSTGPMLSVIGEPPNPRQ
jgi:hypothetical protein